MTTASQVCWNTIGKCLVEDVEIMVVAPTTKDRATHVSTRVTDETTKTNIQITADDRIISEWQRIKNRLYLSSGQRRRQIETDEP
ncbi:hypothetical protein G6F35_018204 [Rhizopus arrhizus]|nr:hypothetical protein G6F40_017386 [Rhizopus arrhizus]KAG1166414.1 hypothetical protein G6F35_018204 [Rhizopus arrhizus]